jgi:ribosomal-protein-alanine N-acetyltransferase
MTDYWHQSGKVAAPEVIDLARIRLRQPRLSDAEAIFEFASDPEVTRYLSWRVCTSIEQITEQTSRLGRRWVSGEFEWVITLPGEDRAIGMASCYVDRHAADFGYFVSRSHWRNGYATEAAQGIVDWAISIPTIWRVWATCDVENLASVRVLEKVGLTLEGRLRRWAVRPNLSSEPRDVFVYSLVR